MKALGIEERLSQLADGLLSAITRYESDLSKQGRGFGGLPEQGFGGGFPPKYILVLSILEQSSRMTMSVLADSASIPLSTATGIVDRLVEDELVTRRRAKEDRRLVVVELTERGRKLVQYHRELRKEVFSRLLSELNEAEKRELLRLLGKAVRKAGS